MAWPQDSCGGMQDYSFFIDRVTIQRANVIHDVTAIRDRKYTYDTIQSSVACYFEDSGTVLVENNQLGRQYISRYNVWFSSHADVLPGDRLLRDNGLYYTVEDYRSLVNEGFGQQVVVRKMGYAAGQA